MIVCSLSNGRLRLHGGDSEPGGRFILPRDSLASTSIVRLLGTSGMESPSSMVISPATTSFLEGIDTATHQGGYCSHTASPLPPVWHRQSHVSVQTLQWANCFGIFTVVQYNRPQVSPRTIADPPFDCDVHGDVTEQRTMCELDWTFGCAGAVTARNSSAQYRNHIPGNVCFMVRWVRCATHKTHGQRRDGVVEAVAQCGELRVRGGPGSLPCIQPSVYGACFTIKTGSPVGSVRGPEQRASARFFSLFNWTGG